MFPGAHFVLELFRKGNRGAKARSWGEGASVQHLNRLYHIENCVLDLIWLLPF